MKKFKLIDFWLQVIIIGVSLILLFTGVFQIQVALFVAGSEQFISIVVHEAAGFFTGAATLRRKYHNVVYGLTLFAVAGLLLLPFRVVYTPLLFLLPFMTAYYLWVCHYETYIYLKRPLSILK